MELVKSIDEDGMSHDCWRPLLSEPPVLDWLRTSVKRCCFVNICLQATTSWTLRSFYHCLLCVRSINTLATRFGKRFRWGIVVRRIDTAPAGCVLYPCPFVTFQLFDEDRNGKIPVDLFREAMHEMVSVVSVFHQVPSRAWLRKAVSPSLLVCMPCVYLDASGSS